MTLKLQSIKAEVTKEELEKLKEIQTNCLKETGVDPSLLEKAFKGEFTEDDKFKEQGLCFHKKLGAIDEEGNINEDKVVELLLKKFPNEELVRSSVKGCIDKKDTPQDTVFEFTKCMYSFAPKDTDIKQLMV